MAKILIFIWLFFVYYAILGFFIANIKSSRIKNITAIIAMAISLFGAYTVVYDDSDKHKPVNIKQEIQEELNEEARQRFIDEQLF